MQILLHLVNDRMCIYMHILVIKNVFDCWCAFAQWSGHIAAVVMYTFDMSIIDAGFLPEENFYFLLNNAMRCREEAFIRDGSAYMYYLMRCLESLPAYTGDWLWRGISAQGRDRMVQEASVHLRQVIPMRKDREQHILNSCSTQTLHRHFRVLNASSGRLCTSCPP
jgi:hypothetical protein